MKSTLAVIKNLLKSKYFWMGTYALVLSLSFTYVNHVLKSDSVDVIEPSGEKDVLDIKPVKVALKVELPSGTKTYEMKKENQDTVMDLMKDLRKNADFRYEKTTYINKILIDHINNIYPQQGYEWRIFLNEEDITNIFEDVNLTDGNTYVIKLVKSQ